MAQRFDIAILLALVALANGFSLNYDPMDCQVTRYNGKRFNGAAGPSGNWFDSEDICLSVCWQYQTQGFNCKGVNYAAKSKTCELIMEEYNPSQFKLTDDANFNYVVPKSCKKPSGNTPKPTPAPTPAPVPNPQPPVGPAGSTNNIRPGSCGQTSVPNKVSRAYLTSKSAHTQRIVGGYEAKPHSVPWIVSLRRYGYWHSCGGTLIRVSPNKDESDIVITAAHCVSDGNADFDVQFGAHYTSKKEAGEESIPASQVVVHQNYGKVGAADIAIIKLSRPVKFSQTIQPACLPEQGEIPQEGLNGMVAGWGALREGGESPDALNQVIVPVMSTATCARSYPDHQGDTEICAGYQQGQKDACQGDSGGPYVTIGKNGFTLQGVVSWGNGCARENAPGVYARVSYFIPWIQQNIRSLSAIRA